MTATDRRTFLARAACACAALAVAPVRALAGAQGRTRAARPGERDGRPDHPDPRPGIDARNVTPADLLPPDVVPVFDRVREIPQVADGIACQCGCAELEGMRSLLSCFEGDGMARHCIYCQGEADLAYRMHRAGRSLDEIRAAVVEQFG